VKNMFGTFTLYFDIAYIYQCGTCHDKIKLHWLW